MNARTFCHASGIPKSLRVVEGRGHREGGEGTHAGCCHEEAGRRIGLRRGQHYAVQRNDAFGHVRSGLHERFHQVPQHRRSAELAGEDLVGAPDEAADLLAEETPKVRSRPRTSASSRTRVETSTSRADSRARIS